MFLVGICMARGEQGSRPCLLVPFGMKGDRETEPHHMALLPRVRALALTAVN